MELIKKIVILGPESTGKTTLCEQLAQHYNSAWVREYARTYLIEHGMNYSYDDLLTIAHGQISLEERGIGELKAKINSHSTNRSGKSADYGLQSSVRYTPLFIDTNMHVMKVWCEFVFSKCHDWILEQIVQRRYDLFLLCNIDLPWVKDDLREYPDFKSREILFRIYKDIMINQPVPWIEISGDYDQRFLKAVAAVDELLAAQ